MHLALKDTVVRINNYADLIFYLLQGGWPSFKGPHQAVEKSEPVPLLTSELFVDPKMNQSTPPETIEVKDPTPRLFALIIGINRYNSKVPSLHGAVPDADDMDNFLRESLKVPADQIRNMRDEEATRSNIISALKSLQDDSRIAHGDAIVVFYAGHGGESTAPPRWVSEDSKTQYILPVDIMTKRPDGKEVYGIPDRTIASLINGIAKEKGDNISIFFDCCHSGSGSRTDEVDPLRLVRGVELNEGSKSPYQVPSDLDKDILESERSRGASIAPGFAQTGLLSHVLLAACGSKERAMEQDKRGNFTKNLLATLRTVGADKVTYKTILDRMPELPFQNPQCEGVNQDRTLFNGKAPSTGRVFYRISKVNGKYVMEGGAAHCITAGAEFSIYKEVESPIESSPLGILKAERVEAFKTTFTSASSSSLPCIESAYAIQTKAGKKEDLRVHVEMNENLIHVFRAIAQHMEHSTSENQTVELVDMDKNPFLHIDLQDGKVVFKNLDPQLSKYEMKQMPYSVDNNINEIYPVIRAAAHFKWHVDLTNPRSTALRNKVELHFVELREREGEYDDDFNPIFEVGKNLNNAGEVYIDEDPDKMYGFKILNNTTLKLFPTLLYFDNSTFEIMSLYQPPSAGRFTPDAPLQPNSSLSIGYGSGGQVPRIFSLPPNRDVDVGFLKLFLSTDYVDYSNIPQPSPFNKGRGASVARMKTIQTWDTVRVAVVQKKGFASNNFEV